MVALLALSIPAIDYAATENADRQVGVSLSSLGGVSYLLKRRLGAETND